MAKGEIHKRRHAQPALLDSLSSHSMALCAAKERRRKKFAGPIQLRTNFVRTFDLASMINRPADSLFVRERIGPRERKRRKQGPTKHAYQAPCNLSRENKRSGSHARN